MATRIYLNQLTGNMHVDVEEEFQQVLEQLWPSTPPKTSITARNLCTFTLAGSGGKDDGRRVFIQSLNVVAVEENVAREET